MTLDSAAFVAIDKAWLDARKSSQMDSDTIDTLNKIGPKYNE